MEPAVPLSASKSSRRRLLRALIGPAALAATGCAAPLGAKRTAPRYISTNMETTPVPTAEPAPQPTPAVTTYAASAPARKPDHLALPLRLTIPGLGVDGPVIAVGLAPDGSMEVPQRPQDVGWYQYSARPGAKGNSVLAGHLNWYGADGVFRRLAEAVPGDAVTVRAADGEERTYAVEWHEEWPLNTAPVGKVFEPLDVPALTLITCGGRWNAATQRYDTRVVIRCQR